MEREPGIPTRKDQNPLPAMRAPLRGPVSSISMLAHHPKPRQPAIRELLPPGLATSHSLSRSLNPDACMGQACLLTAVPLEAELRLLRFPRLLSGSWGCARSCLMVSPHKTFSCYKTLRTAQAGRIETCGELVLRTPGLAIRQWGFGDLKSMVCSPYVQTKKTSKERMLYSLGRLLVARCHVLPTSTRVSSNRTQR